MGNAIISEKSQDMDGRTLFHRFRYHLAKGFVDVGDRVLDVACGTGYGSEILAEAGGWVYAYDIEESNIDYAKDKHYKANITFNVGDIEKCDLEFVDVSVSIESIEHLYKPGDFADKLKGKTNKYIIITVPIGQELVKDELGVHEKGDTTHKSVFQNGDIVDKMFIDSKWKKFYSFRDGVTYIVIYYNNETI